MHPSLFPHLLLAQAIEDFSRKPDVGVILVSLKAASLGVNLVCANHVVLLGERTVQSDVVHVPVPVSCMNLVAANRLVLLGEELVEAFVRCVACGPTRLSRRCGAARGSPLLQRCLIEHMHPARHFAHALPTSSSLASPWLPANPQTCGTTPRWRSRPSTARTASARPSPCT